MRIEIVPGSVKRLVDVWRDTSPLPGEKLPRRIAVDHYGLLGGRPKAVASVPFVDTDRWQRFLVDPCPEGDALLAALKRGPVKPSIRGDAWYVDVDRIQR